MTAANWTAEELDRIGGAEELEIAPPSGTTARRAGRCRSGSFASVTSSLSARGGAPASTV
jgi:hypothetical protein